MNTIKMINRALAKVTVEYGSADNQCGTGFFICKKNPLVLTANHNLDAKIGRLLHIVLS